MSPASMSIGVTDLIQIFQPHVQSAFEPCHCQRVEFFSVTVFALGGTIYVIQDIKQVMKRGIETGTCCDYCYCLHTYH